MSISITQQQAAVLLPLLPRLVAQVPAPTDGTFSEEQMPGKMKESFSTTEMLTRKKKNLKATAAHAALPISKLFIVTANLQECCLYKNTTRHKYLCMRGLGNYSLLLSSDNSERERKSSKHLGQSTINVKSYTSRSSQVF